MQSTDLNHTSRQDIERAEAAIEAAKAKAARDVAKARTRFSMAAALMIIMSLAAGAIVFRALGFETIVTDPYEIERVRFIQLSAAGVALLLAMSLAAALLYPFAGALVVATAASLRSWAWRKEQPPRWSRTICVLLGAIWPFTLLASAIVYIFLGIVHRIF